MTIREVSFESLVESVYPSEDTLLLSQVPWLHEEVSRILVSVSHSLGKLGVIVLKDWKTHPKDTNPRDSYGREYFRKILEDLLWENARNYTSIGMRWTSCNAIRPDLPHTLFWVDPDFRKTGVWILLFETYRRIEEALNLNDSMEEITRNPEIIMFLVSRWYRICWIYFQGTGNEGKDVMVDSSKHNEQYEKYVLPLLQKVVAEKRETNAFFHLKKIGQPLPRSLPHPH